MRHPYSVPRKAASVRDFEVTAIGATCGLPCTRTLVLSSARTSLVDPVTRAPNTPRVLSHGRRASGRRGSNSPSLLRQSFPGRAKRLGGSTVGPPASARPMVHTKGQTLQNPMQARHKVAGRKGKRLRFRQTPRAPPSERRSSGSSELRRDLPRLAWPRSAAFHPGRCRARGLAASPPDKVAVDTWLILPVVICLSQRLSHAGLSTGPIRRNCEWLIKSVMVP